VGIVNTHVVKGLLPPEPPGAKPLPGAADQPWRIGSEFTFATSTRMPANTYVDAAGRTVSSMPDVAELGIQPMGLQGISSQHRVVVQSANGNSVDASRIGIQPIIGQVPQGTWNYVQRDQRTASARTLPALTGLQLIGAPQIVGASAPLPIAKLVDDTNPAKPLPFRLGGMWGAIQGYGMFAEHLAAVTADASSTALVRGAARVLAGNGTFAAARGATGVPSAGLSPLALKALRTSRSAPPLLTPITTGLSLKPVGLPLPQAIHRPRDLGAVVLTAPRLRAVLQARIQPFSATPSGLRTTASRVGANLPRRTPPQLQAIPGASLIRLADAKAPRPTALAQAARSVRSPELGAAASGVVIEAMRQATDAFMGSGIDVPAGTTHIWDLPAGGQPVVEASGDVVLRVTSLNGASMVLEDREVIPGKGLALPLPEGTASLAVTCLGRPSPAAPSQEAARTTSAAMLRGRWSVPAASGWHHGNVFPLVGDRTVLVCSAFVNLAAARVAQVRQQVASQAMAPIEDLMRHQPGAQTWLPAETQVVLILLDHQDAAQASSDDYSVAAANFRLNDQPMVLSYPGRRAVLSDVTPTQPTPTTIGVTVAVRNGWTLAGVIGLKGRATEWQARLRDTIPPQFVSDRPSTPDGTGKVRFRLPMRAGENS
jgi:hypothetical protein